MFQFNSSNSKFEIHYGKFRHKRQQPTRDKRIWFQPKKNGKFTTKILTLFTDRVNIMNQKHFRIALKYPDFQHPTVPKENLLF